MNKVEDAQLTVVPLAWTVLRLEAFELFARLGFVEDQYDPPTDPDTLVEFAGRNCYESFHKPNKDTSANKDYIANIIKQGHESVLEHANVTFYVSGISRNLLLELERHRHLSFSVISTRYVSPDKMGMVLHPNTPEGPIRDIIRAYGKSGRNLADTIYQMCRDRGDDVKAARETARQVLGGNTETKVVVTGNIRTWRHVINLRNHPSADAEIRMFAKEILRHLRAIAPASVQDLPDENL